MAIQPARTQSSVVLTLKVLQFVSQLCRRLKPRQDGASSPPSLGEKTCLGLETKALRSLTKGLARVGLQERKQLSCASDRVCKSRNAFKHKTRPTLKLQTSGQEVPAIQNISGGQVQHMLSSVDGKLSPPGSALSALASNDDLFLKHQKATNFAKSSISDIAQSLVALHDAINVLSTCRSQHDDAWLIAQGHEAGLNFDEAFIANYEHLLLRLQAELIDALGRKVLEGVLHGGHDKKQRRLLSWFTEFSHKPRPLSTFPWSIKPSLAVLWGVCWMFYNSNDLRVSQDAVLQNVELPGWNDPGSADYISFGLELLGTQSQPATQQQLGRDESGDEGRGDLRLRNAGAWDPTHSEFAPHRQDASRGAAVRPNRPGSGLSTYYPHFPAGLHAAHSAFDPLPAASGNATLTVFPQQSYVDTFDQPWQQLPHSSLPQPTARHLTTTPSIRVTGSADSDVYAAPHPDFASLNIYPPSTQQPQALPLHLDTSFSEFVNPPYNMDNCSSLEPSPIHALHGPRHERTSSLNSASNMPTPTSMAGPRSPLLSPVGDRRPSTASSMGPLRHHSEDRSSVSQEEDDIDSLRRNHAFKRAEEPPKNQDGKMVCKNQECNTLTFDRKCEWSKHMDKHDRPYKCNVKGCEKLQGFTYSGGLLRHEREVHKMHGGTKKSLFCLFTDCKRSTGSGFTRKENLAEHVRRVHRRTSMSVDLGHLIVRRSNLFDEASVAEVRLPSESPFPRIAETDEESQRDFKRKRISDAAMSEDGDDDDVRSEVKRLRRENEEKDVRLRQLEAAVMALQQGRR